MTAPWIDPDRAVRALGCGTAAANDNRRNDDAPLPFADHSRAETIALVIVGGFVVFAVLFSLVMP